MLAWEPTSIHAPTPRIAAALVVSTQFLCFQIASGQQPQSGKSPTTLNELSEWFEVLAERVSPAVVQIVKGGVKLDHFGGAKVDQLVKG